MPALLKKAEASDSVGDERRTPRWLFEACERSWGPFVIDCAATKENALEQVWLGPGSQFGEDALKVRLNDISERVEEFLTDEFHHAAHPEMASRAWMNPPYSRGNINRFVAWAAEQARSGWTMCNLIIFDPSLPWWRENIGDPMRPLPWVGEIVVVQKQPVWKNGRVRFEHPSIAKPLGANFPSAIVVMRPPFPWSA